MRSYALFRPGILAPVLILACSTLNAQTAPAHAAAPNLGQGDSLDPAPPLANLSPALKRSAVAVAMRKVGDWELARSQPYFSRDWTFAALYAGYIAAAKALPEPRYETAMLEMGNQFGWTTGPRKAHADDQAVAQTYIALFRDYREPRMIVPTKEQLNAVMTQPDNPAKPIWWWCDALFMAPPVWTGISSVAHDPDYLKYMDREWWITSALLYDSQERLFFRDATFLTKHEANGQKLFWSRGNGWVMAGLARVLEEMPPDYPSRGKYIDQFRQMAARVPASGYRRPLASRTS